MCHLVLNIPDSVVHPVKIAVISIFSWLTDIIVHKIKRFRVSLMY